MKIEELIKQSTDRLSFWSNYITESKIQQMAEIGVYKGEFAANILKNNNSILGYYMIDPWRNLDDWNKPANTDNLTFSEFYDRTLENTDFAKEKRIILRGKTTEVINHIGNETLDFAYIDGDHTLKGISIDLIAVWSKIKIGGSIGGDDLTPSIWQHDFKFEPSMVFPFAVHFAEAVNCPIYLLPYNQFLILKNNVGFLSNDLTGLYKNTEIRTQLTHFKKLSSPNIFDNTFKRLFK